MAERTFPDARRLHELFGSHDRTARAIEKALGVSIAITSSGVTISGSEHDASLAARVLEELYEVAGAGYPVGPEDVERAIEVLSADSSARLRDVFLDPILTTSSRTRIVPRTPHQKAYFDAMRRHDVVFAIGPAGTGKTYLAMAMAVSELLKGRYSRIILTRPAVEAGEKLGFLPGDLAEKVNPYLRPLYDALYDMVSMEKARQMVERGTVEVAPLAFMRGRTLNNAFVILDEAQNTTREQMKMFLTRLGFQSKAVITGDITQVDLPEGRISGLRDAHKVLASIKDIAFVWFDESDVIRHPLVRAIIGAYDAAESGER
ncbi:MAG: PhoH family protein [Candidatus Dadabacteria bacterium]|nr:MAG: PhoH family protein [Candidatus Dadabacteria bacterium]